MKPQDILLALALALSEDVPTYSALGERVGVSTSEAHASVRRLQQAGLVDANRRVRRPALLDFLVHGLRRAYPVKVGAPALGMPTGAAAAEITELPEPEFAPWVWPSPHGTVRGLGLDPLYPSVPDVARGDARLYLLLALVDLLRAGSAREVRYASRRLKELLGGARETVMDSRLDVSSPHALRSIFAREKLLYTIAKWRNEPADGALVRHPLQRVILAESDVDLADHLTAAVPEGAWSAGPAYHVVAEKRYGVRDLSFPSVVDAIAARRLIDELEPMIRRDDGDRVFTARKRPSSRLPPGDYSTWFAEWQRFLESATAAARQREMAAVIKTDIEAFYPSVDLGDARQAVARRTAAHREILGLLFHCLEAWQPRIGYRPVGGLPIDPHDISGLVAHCMLESVDDVFEDSFDLLYRRFVDDTVMFVPSREDADRRLDEHRRALAALGLRPNGGKTDILSTEEYQEAQQLEALETLERAEESGVAALRRWTRAWLSEHDEKKRGHDRVLRRLYTANARRATRFLDARAPADLTDPAYRDYALRYFLALPLDSARLEALQRAYSGAKDGAADLRIGVARVLADGATSDDGVEAELASWAEEQVRQPLRAPGDGYAHGLLLLAAFKHGQPAMVEGLARWATPGRLVDPYLRLFFGYALRAAGEDLPSWLRFDDTQDNTLMFRLCDDAARGRLRNLRRVLGACGEPRRGGGRLSAEILPFLHIVARGVRGEDAEQLAEWLRSLRERVGAGGDRALLRHVDGLRKDVGR